jgi:hypothetical protein
MKIRFTIRDLLWLMVVVALALGWYQYVANTRHHLDVFNHQYMAMEQFLIQQGWHVRWQNATAEFERDKERYVCPMPIPGKDYQWEHFLDNGQ